MLIRNAHENDLPVIIDIYNSTIPSRMVTADTKPVTVESRKTWFYNHRPERPIWVVELNNTIVGWLSYSDFFNKRPAYDATAEISIYIAKFHRCKGMGKILLKRMTKRT